jgi:hypothetical protein
MSIEAQEGGNPLIAALFALPDWLSKRIAAPHSALISQFDLHRLARFL